MMSSIRSVAHRILKESLLWMKVFVMDEVMDAFRGDI